MFEQITYKKPWIKIKRITVGWSSDKKYHIIGNDNSEFVLRVSSLDQVEKREKQYKMLSKIRTLDITVSKALYFGKTSDFVYMIFEWIDGVNADQYIKKLTNKEQYIFGIKAGKILKKLHQIEVDIDKDWHTLYINKIHKKTELIANCKTDMPYKTIISEYVNINMDKTKNRSIKFQHGDYHLGNMIISNNELYIIDFDKCDTADPYDEFKPFCWNVLISPEFENGLIDGYFNNKISNDFFGILALYAAESLMGHLPWAERFGKKEIDTALLVADKTLEWFKDFKIEIPTWYIKEQV